MITPQEANQPPDTSALEQRIDNATRHAARRGQWPCTVTVTDVSRLVVTRAIAMYTDAGWAVESVTDQRDGNRACGIAAPNVKLWLFDVDKIDESTNRLAATLARDGHLVARIPSRKGEHLIAKPFDGREYWGGRGPAAFGEVELHKDNPTNLYIPDGAA